MPLRWLPVWGTPVWRTPVRRSCRTWETALAARRSIKRLQDPSTVISYVVEIKDIKGRPPAGTDQFVQIVRIEFRSLNKNGSEPHNHRHRGHPEQRTVRANKAR